MTADPSNRDENTTILKVKQGYEPPTFTGFFGVWDTSLWNVSYSTGLIYDKVQLHNTQAAKVWATQEKSHVLTSLSINGLSAQGS
jgi:hypothetical protein